MQSEKPQGSDTESPRKSKSREYSIKDLIQMLSNDPKTNIPLNLYKQNNIILRQNIFYEIIGLLGSQPLEQEVGGV